MTLICAQCTNPFTAPQRCRKFCSQKCSRLGQERKGQPRRGRTTNCTVCGKEMYVPLSAAAFGWIGKYCGPCYRGVLRVRAIAGRGIPKSPETKAKLSANRANRPRGKAHRLWKPEQPTRTCIECGSAFVPPKRIGNRGLTKRRYCSRLCWYNHIRREKQLHPAWRGGPIHHYGPNWRTQQAKVLQRDKNTCQRCGKEGTARKVDVHHKRLFRDCPDYLTANQLSNLVSLCNPCHRLVHAGKDPRFLDAPC